MRRFIFQITPLYLMFASAGTTLAKELYLSADEQNKYLKVMQKKLSPLKQLQAKFTQTREISAFKDKLVSHGVFYFEFPSKLRWELIRPFKSLIIFDGYTARKYRFHDNSWQQKEFAGSDFIKMIMEDILSWTRGDFTKTTDKYQLKISKQHKIVLTPKNKKTTNFISAIELSIDSKTQYIKKVAIKDPGKDYVTIEFTDMSDKPFSDKSLFKEQQ